VINFKESFYSSIQIDEYKTARKYSGQILHTIQDFYSHSNWVEMGNTIEINTEIGTTEFEKNERIVNKDTETSNF
jgi:hypothetical protein